MDNNSEKTSRSISNYNVSINLPDWKSIGEKQYEDIDKNKKKSNRIIVGVSILAVLLIALVYVSK